MDRDLDGAWRRRADWLSVMPPLPLRGVVPVIDATSGGRGILLPTGRICPREPPGTGPIARSGVLRVDLDDPQGFAYALRWLARRRMDLGRGDWPNELGGICLRHLVGLTGSGDRIGLARACAVALEEDREWRSFVDAWSRLSSRVSGPELALLLDEDAKIERFGSDLMELPAEQRVLIVRAHLCGAGISGGS
ncbi:MAG TPA: hypothetical protein ENK18_24740 [Deltaproteobacteria bacterium]|nr:hypothetical protein [Deltaproteobacteria bacterium]